MVALLALLYAQPPRDETPAFPEIPLAAIARNLVRELRDAARRTSGAFEMAAEEL